jgi:transcriptional regulator with XRE-family HTH domain
MNEAASRLKNARISAGYDTAKDAAVAMGVSDATYTQHENGTRGFPASRAQRYARFFRTTPEWLIYGRGLNELPSTEPTIAELENMIANALSEVTLGVRIGDLPQIIAPSLHAQLEFFRADRI